MYLIMQIANLEIILEEVLKDQEEKEQLELEQKMFEVIEWLELQKK